MTHRSERGQILIMGAVAMVVLIGIAGLVIDLGFSWMLRRSEQNAVDPATIAAARYIPDGDVGAMEEAACFFARENGFFPGATTYDLGSSGCVASNDPNGALLTVNWPPASGNYVGNPGYVEVILDSGHATFFSKIFGFDWMSVSSNAVAANTTAGTGAGQLVALDPTNCLAGQIRGNGTTFVEGSVYVNSDGTQPPPGCVGPFDDTCSGSSGAFSFAGINAQLVTANLSVRGTCGQNANPYPTYCTPPATCGLTEGAPQIDDPFNLPTPTIAWAGVPAVGTSDTGSPPDLANCDGPTDTGCSFSGGGSWYVLNPGVYYGGWTIQRPVYLNPGFYYFAGGGIQVSGQGGIITIGPSGYAIDPATGMPTSPDLGEGRILLYGTDGPNCSTIGGRTCQGTISLTGQGGFQAKAYEQDPSDPFDDSYQRILIWQAEGTSRTLPVDTDFTNDMVQIAGQGDLDFWGTMYAPKSRVVILGNGNGAGSIAGVQILAWQFDVGGNGNLFMPFDPDELSPILNKGLVQ